MTQTNVERLPKRILEDIKGNVPMYSKTEEYTDEQVNSMSNRELLDHWLNYNGFIDYTGTILNIINHIYGLELT